MRYVEKETGIGVTIAGLAPWEGEPPMSVVTYPCGRSYTMRPETVALHFDAVVPQVVSMSGHGGGQHDRPTKRQIEVQRGHGTNTA